MRQNFAKQKRRQHIENIFKQRRKENSQKQIQNQRQHFLSLLPTIDMQNYENHRFQLSQFARSNNYSYEMLPIAFISFEYLQSFPSDSPSWQILTYLSYYEDFQIPQTQQFVDILIQYLNEDPELISQFLFNIPKLSKCSLLCCRLIDASLFYIIEEKLQQIQKNYVNESFANKFQKFNGKQNMELMIYNFLYSICSLLSIQPTIEFHQMNKICEIVKIENSTNKFINKVHHQATFDLLQNAVESLSHQPEVIKLLFDHFSLFIENLFFSFSGESIKFLECCVKNKVELSEVLIKNLIVSITNEKSSEMKANALKVVRQILNSTNKSEKMQVEPNKIQDLKPFIDKTVSISFDDFNSLFSSNNQKSKDTVYQEQIQNCMKVFTVLFSQDYQNELKKLFELFYIQKAFVKEEIAMLIQSMISSLIREIESYDSNIIFMKNSKKEIFDPQRLESFLFETVKLKELYFWIEECLKSPDVSLIEVAEKMLMEIYIYLRDFEDEIEEGKPGVNLDFILDQIHNSGIYTCLQDLSVSENPTISNLAEDLVEMMQTPESQVL